MPEAPRVLVAIAPRSYRESLALSVRVHRPHAEVLLVDPESLEAELEGLSPHLVVCNEATGAVRAAAHSWIEILVHDSLKANVRVGHREEEHFADISLENVLEAVDLTEKSLPQRGGG
jgi:hypothetical protein